MRRFSHAISIYQNVQAHQQAIRTVTMVEDGSLLLTGSSDKTIKTWNPNLERWSPDSSIDFPGPIQHLEMRDDILLLSMDCIVDSISSGEPVGQLQLINTKTNARIDCKVKS